MINFKAKYVIEIAKAKADLEPKIASEEEVEGEETQGGRMLSLLSPRPLKPLLYDYELFIITSTLGLWALH